MTIFLYLFVLANNWYFALRRKSNQVWVILTLGFIFLVFSGAGPFYSFHADYHNYYRNYYNVLERGLFDNNQFGYALIMTISNYLGLSFVAFRLLVIAACIGILYKFVIARYEINVNYVLSLYLLYAIIIDSEQFRNWIAFTVLLAGLPYLEKSLLINKVKFAVFWIISISFHYSFVFFVPLFFVNGENRNKLISRLVWLSLIVTSVIILNGNEIPFQNILLNYTDNRVIRSYLTTQTNFGYLIPMVLHFSSIFLSYWSRRILQNKYRFLPLSMEPSDINYNDYLLKKDELKLVNLVYWANLAMLIVLPLYIVNVQFYRLMRSILLITYIVCSKASLQLVRRTHFVAFNVFVLGSVFLWLFLDLIHRIDPGRLLLPFFLENIL